MTDTHDSIPPNELDRRRRVLACVTDIGDLAKDIGERLFELRDLGVPAADWMPLVADQLPSPIGTVLHQYGHFFVGFIDGFMDARVAGAKNATEGVVAAIAGEMSRKIEREKDPRRAVEDGDDPAYDDLSWEGQRTKRVIDRLFADAPKKTDARGNPDPTQAPALECHIMLKAGGSIQGALSVTPEGTLRLLQANQIGQKPVMIEHFFDYEQVADIAVFREVKATEGTRIITS